MWWKKKVSEVSTSEDDLDDSGGDSDNEEEDEEHNSGPTLVTVDDGKGGVKHIKVSQMGNIRVVFLSGCKSTFTAK